MNQTPEEEVKIVYEAPVLQDFDFGLTLVEGWSGFDCPPRRPAYEDDYGSNLGDL